LKAYIGNEAAYGLTQPFEYASIIVST